MQIDRVVNVSVPPTPSRLAFLTPSELSLSTINGIEDLDAACQMEAELGGLSSGGQPSFKALARNGQTAPALRFDPDGLPWARPDNVLLMATAAGLTAQDLLAPPSLASDGTYLPTRTGLGSVFWTGASHWGSTVNANCNDWMTSSSAAQGTVGSADIATAPSNYRTFTCDQPAHLLCLEQ